MIFGTVLGIYNHMHFKNTLTIFVETIPQIIFMCSIFGYLAVMIIVKWISPKDISLLNTLIFMVLKVGEDIKYELYPGQVCRYLKRTLILMILYW
jgi:V-type H+-transporting ATPase subunit a